MERINQPLLGDDSKSTNNPLINSILLGCAMFFILYFVSSSTYYPISNVGTFFLFILYFASCFISPFIIIRTREKIAILISLIVLFVTFIFNFYIYSVSFISFITSPFAIELLWISAGSFIYCNSEKSNIGFNFGMFFGFTQLIRALYGYSLTGRFGYNDAGYIIIFLLFLVIGGVLVLLLRNPHTINVENIETSEPFIQEISKPFFIITERSFLYIIPAILFLGFSDSYYNGTGVFVLFYTNYSLGILGTTYLFGAMSSVLVGYLFDCRVVKKLYIVLGLFVIGMISTIISLAYWYGNNSLVYNSNLYATSAIGYTIFRCGIYVFVYSIVGLIFEKKSISTSAAIRIVQLVGSVIAFIFISWVYNYVASFYIYSLFLIAGCLSLVYFLKINHDQYCEQ